MSLNTGGAVFGAFMGVVVALLCRVVTSEVWIIALILGVLALICFIIATVTVKGAETEEEPITALTRGVLIGINSVLNGFLAYLIIGALSNSDTAGLVVGLTLSGLNFIASIGVISRWSVYQGLIGWLNWIMPMSWLIVVLGVAFVLISLIFHVLLHLPFKILFFRFGVPSDSGTALAGKSIDVDWATGTIFIFGGFASNCNIYKTAFNMGNFSFVHRESDVAHIEHESGHSLNLGAFGSFIHLVGAVDEWVFSHENALTEKLAESHHPASARPKLLMWS
ncbi:MAG: hypothetical protein SGI73_04935 [Chloroflexota bacterium]|nr:hypothetical protein [Chloroflexota bacterium]